MASPWGCGACPRRWTGLREAHCPSCHAHFSTETNFDAHRVNGKCIDPAKAIARGRPLKAVAGPNGITWVMDAEKEVLA